MILILTEKKDISANKVIEWLYYYKAKYLRIDIEYLYDSIYKVQLNNDKIIIEFKYKENLYSLDDFTVVWCRRGAFNTSFNIDFYENQILTCDAKQNIRTHLNNESETLLNFVYEQIRKKSIFLKRYVMKQCNYMSEMRLNRDRVSLLKSGAGVFQPYLHPDSRGFPTVPTSR